MMNIVLLEPEIPQNTGNISRTCAATGTRLHLIRPFGFEITDARLKRAGLDYWHLLDISYYDNWQDFCDKNPDAVCYFASTKAKHRYDEPQYPDNAYLVFGKETKGIPEELLAANYDTTVRIPMRAEARSLNLSNSVAVVLFEALRQQGFPHLKEEGQLTTITVTEE
ncbi:MAG: tRNA (cytidine(34)-2'-O)-methyltransferase [Clostridia bacterium]|nr:tRNA (cytidine(34)-2'-O)-methyltransferase [Clostridia bacterium]